MYTGLQPRCPRETLRPVTRAAEFQAPGVGAWIDPEQARRLPLPGVLQAISLGGLEKDVAVEILSMHAAGDKGAVGAKDAAHAMVVLYALLMQGSMEGKTDGAQRVPSAAQQSDDDARNAMHRFASILLQHLKSQNRVSQAEAMALLAGVGLLGKKEKEWRAHQDRRGAAIAAKDVSRILVAIGGSDAHPEGEMREVMLAALEELQYFAPQDIDLGEVRALATALADMADRGGDLVETEGFTLALERVVAALMDRAEDDIEAVAGSHIAEVARAHLSSGRACGEVSYLLSKTALRMSENSLDIPSVATLLQVCVLTPGLIHQKIVRMSLQKLRK